VRNAFTLTGLMLLVCSSVASAAYPDHPIRLIVATAPGGAQTANARAIARQVEAQLGHAIVIDNRGGANGIIGYDLVAKANPDGYTLLHTSVAFVINAAVYKKLPFRVERDFAPITNVCTGQGALLVVNPAVPAQTLKQFIALAKTSAVHYSSPGLGNGLQLIAEYFNVQAGTRMQHVPYKGAGPALVAVLGGEAQATFTTATVGTPHIKSGRLRTFGYSGATRVEALPEVPTLAEAGLPGFQIDTGWHAWFAPARTPEAIVARLHGEIVKALDVKELRDFLLVNGYQPVAEPPAAFRKTFEADIKRWGDIARLAKIEPQ
jgi:tripartite-type tricarboxylate transporter receptor subunit TctC